MATKEMSEREYLAYGVMQRLNDKGAIPTGAMSREAAMQRLRRLEEEIADRRRQLASICAEESALQTERQAIVERLLRQYQ